MNHADQRAPMIPFLDVSHLPSSTSFYSAILQPLGIQYIQVACPPDEQSCAAVGTCQNSRIVSFGEPTSIATPILQLRETASTLEPLKISRVVLTAPSPDAVVDFQVCAARAGGSTSTSDNSRSLVPLAPNTNLNDPYGSHGSYGTGTTKATVTDFDGNTMEVIYPGPTQYPAHYQGPVVRRTQSTNKEVSRILDWNYDVARSSPPSFTTGTPASRALARQDEAYPTMLRRSVTTSTYQYPVKQEPAGVSTGAVAGLLGVGMAVGMGVGAALTYSSMKSDRSRAPLQEFDAPTFQRRATYPERLPSERGGRYVEVERTVEKYRYPEDQDYSAVGSSRVTQQNAAKYSSQAGSTTKSRAVDDMYDSRSRHSTRYQGSTRGSMVRTRSEAAETRSPFLLPEAEHRSQASSRLGPSMSHRSSHRSAVVDAEAASYASARSHRSSARSSATVRPLPPPPPPVAASHVTEVVARSKSGSRVTATTTIKVPAGSQVSRPPNASRSGSRMSARHVPLPRSSVASSHESAWVDDHDSVAPSDSISCAGSRRRSHAYH